MKVRAWIEAHPGTAITLPEDASVESAVDALLTRPGLRDVYVVSESGRVVGHLSHKRLQRIALSDHRPAHTRRQLMEKVARGAAKELMNEHFPTASPDEELDNILHRQIEHDIEDMPVIDDDGALLGAVNLTAVLRVLREADRG